MSSVPLPPLPPFVFRIDEIRENPNAPPTPTNRADWEPSLTPGGNVRVAGGVSGKWYCCNGKAIGNVAVEQFPQGMQHYKTYSMFYLGGFGFWVLQGDATSPGGSVTWQPLRFDHQNDFSSYLCNVSQSSILACRRANQNWLKMLLPDIYYNSAAETPYPQYGALKGELAIFLALIAFAIQPTSLPHILPAMLKDGVWQTYHMPDGRVERRGVVVYVYTWPPHGSAHNLANFESGGSYFR